MLSALFFKYKYHYSVSLKLAIPIIISQLGHILVGMADSIIIGHTNSAALAACAISNSIFGIFMVTGIGISYGLTPLISQEYGRKNFKLCGNLLSDSLWINTITGVILYVLLELSMRFAYKLNQPEEVIGQAIIYTKYLALSMIPLMIYLTFKQFTEGLGLTKQSMNITIAGNLVNIVLGVVLVFGLFGVKPMGIAGIGISTLVDRILMAAAMAFYAFLGKKTQPFIANFKLKSFSWTNTKNILKIGMPMSLLYIFEFGAFSISMIMSGWINTTSQAAMQIAINAANPSYMIASGLGSAATVKAGNYYGAGNMKHLRLSGLSSYHLVIFFLCVYTIVFVIIRNYIPLIYVNSSDTAVIAFASKLLIVYGDLLILDGIKVIGIALLYYVFKAQSVANIFRLIVTSNIYLLILSTIVFFITHIFRAFRWQILIETFNIKPSKSMLYNAIMSSLLVNIFITRFGEIYRCYLINKTDQLPVSTLIGTVVTERIIDLLSLLIIVVTVVLTNYQLSANYFNEHILHKITYNQILVIGSALASMLLISILIIFLLYKYKRENYIVVKVKNFLKGLYTGVLSITKIKQKLAFFINTILIWFCYWLFTYIITLAFPATNNLSPITSILILALSGISMALPIQSGIGAFHILISNALLLYAIPGDQALAYATLAHGLPLATVLILGSISFLSIYLNLKKKKKYVQIGYDTK